jgi:hypothetical protein
MPMLQTQVRLYASLEDCFDLVYSFVPYQIAAQELGYAFLFEPTMPQVLLPELQVQVRLPNNWLGMEANLFLNNKNIDPPHNFDLELVKGSLSTFKHKHLFEWIDWNQTEIIDIIRFETTMGLFKNKWERQIKELIQKRNCVITDILTQTHWRNEFNIPRFESQEQQEEEDSTPT